MRWRRDPRIAELEAQVPRGDGHAVLVLPPSLRSDRHTWHVRRFLGNIGYRPYTWNLGVNLGPGPRTVAGLETRLAALAVDHGPVSLIGFSMGGLFARWLAVRRPAEARGIVTVCSPFRAPLDSLFLPLDRLAEAWPGPDLAELADEVARPFAAPATFIYSREDGIVAWDSCRDPERPDDNFETHGTHVTISRNLDIFRIIAERLARPA